MSMVNPQHAPKASNRIKLSDRFIDRLKPPGQQTLIADSVVTGLYLRVGSDAKHKSFVLDYSRTDGRRARFTIGSSAKWSVARARDKARELQAYIRGGGCPQTDKKQIRWSKDFALGPFAELPQTETGIAPSQAERILSTFRFLYSTPMADTTEERLERWRQKQLKRGIKPGTLNRDRNSIRAVLQRAVKLNLITVNPLANWESLDAPRENRIRFLSPDERTRLESELVSGDYPQWFVDLNHIALDTGMRLGESLKIKYEDLYMNDPPHIRLKASDTKTAKSRNIPMTKRVFAILTRLLADKPDVSEIIFHNPATGSKRTTLRPHFPRLMDACSINDYTWHCHRHSFASEIMMRGGNIYDLCTLLGHSSVDQTMKYSHLSTDHLNSVINLLD